MNCEVLWEVSFFLLQTNWWKVQRWVEQAQKLMDAGIVRLKLGDVGTRLWRNKFEWCVWVSASSRIQIPAVNVIPFTSDSLRKTNIRSYLLFWILEYLQVERGILMILVFSPGSSLPPPLRKYLRVSQSVAEVMAPTQLWTVGPSQAQRILGANGSSPTLFSQRTCQGWHKQGTAQLHCLIWADFPLWAYFHLWLKPSRHNNVPMPAHLTHSMFILPFWLVLGSLGLFPVEIIVSITR